MKGKISVIVLDVIIAIILALSIGTKSSSVIGNLSSNSNKAPMVSEDKSFNFVARPEEKRVKAGETVTVAISAEDIDVGEEGINSIVGYLGYNEELFDSVEIKTPAESRWRIELNKDKNHSLYGKFCLYTMQEGITDNQEIATMTLKLKDDLKPQTTKVTFTNLASSDGEYEVLEEDRAVTLIIYEEGQPVPEEPVEPEEPAKPEEPKEVKTGDKIAVMAVIFVLAVILNVAAFAGKKTNKILSMVLVLFVGLACFRGVAKAIENDAEVTNILNNLSYRQSWLNSEKYLVTEENISRFFPETKVDKIENKFNKEIEVDASETNAEEGMLATGTKIGVKNPTKVDAEGDYKYLVSVWGDTNGDGKSNQVELTRIIRNVVDNEKWELTGVKYISADLTVDNKIQEDDVKASVNYIVYGEVEIPEFRQVEEPSFEVVSGTYIEDGGFYETDVELKIQEEANNGAKTQYKVENAEGELVPYTEIQREVKNAEGKYETIITLEHGDIYKVSAYTTGDLGNRSGIPYKIINGVGTRAREYRTEYYYNNVIDTTKTETQYAEIGAVINTYIDKVADGYELDTEKGTDGVEGLPLTVSENVSENVIKVYYKSIPTFWITGEVVYENGEIEGVPEEVIQGHDSEEEIVITPKNGYKVKSIRLYTGSEVDGNYDETDGEDVTNTLFNKVRKGIYVLIDPFENVTENMHIYVTCETADFVAQIIGVPGDNEDLANLPSNVDRQPILNHKYTSLEDAIDDSMKVNNNKGDIDGRVTIILLKDIEGESNDIESNNIVTIDLNGQTITLDSEEYDLRVLSGGDLTIINSGSEINETTNEPSQVINTQGTAILVKSGGSLTIGVNDDGEPSITTPVINGAAYSIYKEVDDSGVGVIKFYDGKLVGSQDGSETHVIGCNDSTVNLVNDTPALYSVTSEVIDGQACFILQRVSGVEAVIGNTTYAKLEDAFKAVNSGNYTIDEPVTIQVVSDNQVILDRDDGDGTYPCSINSNRYVKLDLNGRTITGTTDRLTAIHVCENAKLQITDSAAQDESIENGRVYAVRIYNEGDMVVNKAAIASSDNSSNLIYTSNEATGTTLFVKDSAINGSLSGADTIVIDNSTVSGNVKLDSYTGHDRKIQVNNGAKINGVVSAPEVVVNDGDIATVIGGTVRIEDGHIGNTISYSSDGSRDYYADTLIINGGIVEELDTARVRTEVKDAEIHNMVCRSSTVDGGPQIFVNNSTVGDITSKYYVGSDGYTVGSGDVTLDITNSTIESIKTYGSYTNLNYTINMHSGEINSNGIAIDTNNKSVVIIGNKNTAQDTTVSTTDPVIKGLAAGIHGDCTVNFYDGVIISPENKQLDGAILNEREVQDGVPLNLVRETFTEGDITLEKLYLQASTVSVARVSAASADVTGLNPSTYELRDNYYYFTSLESAITACSANNAKIEILEDIINEGNIEVPSSKNIEIDLCGNTVQYTKLINNGTLKISDTANEKGALNSKIDSNESLTISGANVNGDIVNNKTMAVNGGTLTKVTCSEETTFNMTAGTVTTSITSNGTVTINEASENSIRVYDLTVNSGSITVNGGKYQTLNCNGSTQGTISNVTVGHEFYSREDTGITIGDHGNVTISNSTVQSISNDGEVTITDSVIAQERNQVGGVRRNSGVMIFGGTIDLIYDDITNNTGTITIPSGCTFNAEERAIMSSGTVSISENSSTTLRYIASDSNGTLNLGNKNGDIKYNTILIKQGLANGGTLNFYDGKVIGTYTNTSGNIDTENGYEIRTETEEGQQVTTLRQLIGIFSVPVNKIASIDGINCTLVDDHYEFYELKDVAAAIVANEEVTVTVINDKEYIGTKATDVIPENKNILLELNGHLIKYMADNAITNNGTLIIQDSSNEKTGEIASDYDMFVNNGTLTIKSGIIGKFNTKTIISNTGTLSVEEDVRINDEGIIENLEDGYADIDGTNKYVKIINNTNSSNANAGMRITGNATNVKSIKNESGNVLLENGTFNGFYPSEIKNYDTLTIKDSTLKIIETYGSETTSTVVNIENSTVNSVSARSGLNNTINIGKEGDDFTDANTVVKGISTSGSNTDAVFNFYSGVIYDTDRPMETPVIIPTAANLNCEKQEDNYKYTLVARDYVAQIGQTKYYTLKDAVDACAGQQDVEIDVISDIQLTSGREVEIDDSIILDLNGNTIYLNASEGITVNNKLKVIDSVGDGYIRGTIVNNGVLEFNGTNSTAVSELHEAGLVIKNAGELNIIDNTYFMTLRLTGGNGSINVNNSSVDRIYTNPYYDSPENTITITNNSDIKDVQLESYYNVELNAEDSTFRTLNAPNCTVDNCTVTSTAGFSGESTITNSTLATTGVTGSNTLIKDSEISGYTTVNTTGNAIFENCIINNGVQIAAGTLQLLGGKITSTSTGVYMKENRSAYNSTIAKLIIGSDDTTVHHDAPEIHAATYGIVQQCLDTGWLPVNQEIEFYDGIIKGDVKALKTYGVTGGRGYSVNSEITINKVPLLHEYCKSEDEKEVTLRLKGAYMDVVTVQGVAFKRERLNEAVAEALDKNATIEVTNSFALESTWLIAQGLGTDKELTIDLKGHSIEANMADPIINNTITLNIVDSVGGGYIKNYTGNAIDNHGNINVDPGIIQ